MALRCPDEASGLDAVGEGLAEWARRPQGAALVAAMAGSRRGFDAIVVGEYERAFCASQYALMAPLFEHYGVAAVDADGREGG